MPTERTRRALGVALLASFTLLGGCGVGLDDLEGLEAAHGAGALAWALEGAPPDSAPGTSPAAPVTQTTQAHLDAEFGGEVNSPQDPIPALELRTSPQEAAAPLPGYDPRATFGW